MIDKISEKGRLNPMSKRALVVEDDENIAELLRLYLGKDGFDVMISPDGGKAESMFDLFQPDVVLLDIMLPVKDGWEVCREIRKKSSTPIIMLTAKGETADKINGLNMGADDYVTKPFDVKELLARIHAVMRRTDADAPVEKKLVYDKLVINLESYELIVDGKKIDTPPKEMELLYHLAASPNRVYTRNQLLDEVWGFDYFGDSRTVDVHVKRLREKLEGVSDKWCLKTVWGVGYKAVHAGFQGQLAVLLKGVGRHGDDGDPRLGRIVQLADELGRLVAVHGRHLDVHEDHVIGSGGGIAHHLHGDRAVRGDVQGKA